uniref:50S ribosomal protein L2 n=1 Tax=Steinernema glaseri TaxID=37863 RepID=A0A1I8A5C4_9BILA
MKKSKMSANRKPYAVEHRDKGQSDSTFVLADSSVKPPSRGLELRLGNSSTWRTATRPHAHIIGMIEK